ncbi:MAG: bifunctional demethylmenaquinone methyltransferase/2-methoxy-6-polyprenyl-1,4-benzoquinol methylase UbiE [Bacteroidaceae bacterium]|nr:bifunctional demethylmenaquinone methyltransferase/2-methoxy-6-polyprenyl-1,4-benzoquinol methylase UbiE [Bacteroidaceae bacterium]
MPDKEKIRKLFDDIAPQYDSFNHKSSFGTDRSWRRKAVMEIADTDSPINVLDVATGTADFAIAVSRQAAPGSHVTGIDISESMLEIGRDKSKGLPIDFMTAQAEALPFPNCTFDRVCVAFGVRNFEDRMKGLSEMCRVLKKGGKLVILELSYPKNKLIRAFFKLYALKILPKIGIRMTGNANAFNYLPESILIFPLPHEFMPMLNQAGFNKVRHSQFMFGICRMYVAYK